jgi:hypothetical protein
VVDKIKKKEMNRGKRKGPDGEKVNFLPHEDIHQHLLV